MNVRFFFQEMSLRERFTHFADPKKKRTKTSEALPKGCFLEKARVFALRWAVSCEVLGDWSGSV